MNREKKKVNIRLPDTILTPQMTAATTRLPRRIQHRPALVTRPADAHPRLLVRPVRMAVVRQPQRVPLLLLLLLILQRSTTAAPHVHAVRTESRLHRRDQLRAVVALFFLQL